MFLVPILILLSIAGLTRGVGIRANAVLVERQPRHLTLSWRF
jgi:hypothetical protein